MDPILPRSEPVRRARPRFFQIVPPGTQYDFVRHFRLAASLSAGFLLASAIAIPLRGVRLGIDFAGGYQVVPAVAAARNVDAAEIRSALVAFGFEDAQVAEEGGSGENVFQIRFAASVSPDAAQAARAVESAIETHTGAPVTIQKADFVGPRVGAELRREALLALAIAFALIFAYVAVRFTPAYAPGAIVALVHDVAFTAGMFVLFGWEFDMNVFAALLTIIGYSVNDTIVIFDRIRELRGRRAELPARELINTALNQTLSRTLLTSGTTLMAVLALLLFGGPVLWGYSVAMTIGIVVGTGSSIYVATPILLGVEGLVARRRRTTRKPGSRVAGSEGSHRP